MRPFLSILRREWQLSLRGPAPWALMGLASALAAWRVSAAGCSSALAAYQAKQVIVLGVGVLATLLAGSAATRDRRQAAAELVFAKPVGVSPVLVVARLGGLLVALALVAVVVLAAASISQRLLGGTAWRPLPYVAVFAQSVMPLAFACALGFSLSSLFTTPLASGIATIYWVTVPLARAHIPAILDLTLSQHWAVAGLLSVALISLTATFHGRPLRGASPVGVRLGWLTVVALLLAAVSVVWVLAAGDDALVNPDPVLVAMSAQSCLPGKRAPGFWMPDARGQLVALSDYAGRPAVVVFWSPAAPESAGVLAGLNEVAEEFSGGGQARQEEGGVTCIAVCLDRDAGTVGLFADQVSDRVALVWDRGRHFGRGAEWSDSPIATCYDVGEVPTVFLLDRDRTYVGQSQGEAGSSHLRRSVSELLSKP